MSTMVQNIFFGARDSPHNSHLSSPVFSIVLIIDPVCQIA